MPCLHVSYTGDAASVNLDQGLAINLNFKKGQPRRLVAHPSTSSEECKTEQLMKNVHGSIDY